MYLCKGRFEPYTCRVKNSVFTNRVTIIVRLLNSIYIPPRRFLKLSSKGGL